MTIHIVNGFTCCARVPSNWKTGLVCLLIETNQGLTLVDTGLDLQDYANPTWFTQLFRIVTYMPFDPNEAAINQLHKFGYKSEDVKHIILTHMHFDHLGGLADFPHAKVHVYKKEYDAFIQRKGNLNTAYVPRHIARKPDFVFMKTLVKRGSILMPSRSRVSSLKCTSFPCRITPSACAALP